MEKGVQVRDLVAWDLVMEFQHADMGHHSFYTERELGFLGFDSHLGLEQVEGYSQIWANRMGIWSRAWDMEQEWNTDGSYAMQIGNRNGASQIDTLSHHYQALHSLNPST